VTHGRKTTDFVICFECFRFQVLLPGEENVIELLISDKAQASFDKALRGAGVPLAKKPGRKD
jgi:hypothetical protein